MVGAWQLADNVVLQNQHGAQPPRPNIKETKMNKSRIFVYAILGIVALVVVAGTVIYLPGLMQTLHGTG